MADAQRRVEDVGSVMDAAGLDSAVLFATADGGAIALRFAASHPERVQALVLIASTARMLPAEDYDAGIAVDIEPCVRSGTGAGETRSLFGDIVGSTETAARLGDRRWRDLLESHNGLVRSGLRRFGGDEVKFTGDGFLALFELPDEALDFSLAVVDEVKALGVELRVGVHTGTVELRGDDVAGLAVNVAARLLGYADGSKVVVTRTVRDLLGGSNRPTEPLGRHELRGIPDEWELYRIGS